MPKHIITKEYDHISNVITSAVSICNPQNGYVLATEAIWDTGATHSVITQEAAKQLGLVMVSMATVQGVGGMMRSPVYAIVVTIDNEEIALHATECHALSADGKVGCLIGMDVINNGDFTITNFDGKTMMSFQIPSTHKTDYRNE